MRTCLVQLRNPPGVHFRVLVDRIAAWLFSCLPGSIKIALNAGRQQPNKMGQPKKKSPKKSTTLSDMKGNIHKGVLNL